MSKWFCRMYFKEENFLYFQVLPGVSYRRKEDRLTLRFWKVGLDRQPAVWVPHKGPKHVFMVEFLPIRTMTYEVDGYIDYNSNHWVIITLLTTKHLFTIYISRLKGKTIHSEPWSLPKKQSKSVKRRTKIENGEQL